MGLANPYFPAPAARRADILVYVDFDGVLQHHAVYWHPKRGVYMHPQEAEGRALFEWAHYLESALLEFPDVRLVLSSSWCVRPGYGKALRRLTEGLGAKFIGGTFHRRIHGVDPWTLASFKATPRALQIWNDVQRRKPVHWLALDDDVTDWPPAHSKNLVACDGTTGVSSPGVQAELREKLSAFGPGPYC